ncbi:MULTISPECIES: DUF934 domain-containing protein [unclassified Sphingomonas]|uniref:DUF934 domain-containing protein n=1 Tax=unclassified Sphingomonas TaxID=196159 RepID=UPI0006F8C7A9|nr:MULTISPECIES: DUF934 domain-containing protein [unclassified Sphingomonas]KQX22844.1 oxidoreductase [Sphingomonas sp. Root1294]KQY67816.1 oxidoreductase [Sphingomonas sp. Root50]KRB88740.1 oxidoreductase [Sphingomonas sp. Root720]
MGDLIRFRDDETHEEPAVTLDAFLGQSNATAVRLEPTDDPRELIPHLDRLSLIEVSFPKFRDGRGYSIGSILREAGYAGELRAAGDVLVDQIGPMRRCGFDAFLSDAEIDRDTLARLAALYDDVYQKTVDGRRPIWAKRHG